LVGCAAKTGGAVATQQLASYRHRSFDRVHKWGIPDNAIEAAGPAGQFVFADLVRRLGLEDLGEGQVPVEEVVLVAEPEQFFLLGRREVVRVVLPTAEDGFGDLDGRVRALLADEGGTPGVGDQPRILVRRRADQIDEVLLLGDEGFGRRVVLVGQVGEGLDEVSELEPLGPAEGEQPLAVAFFLVSLLEFGADLLVIALDGLEGVVGDAALHQGRGGSEQAVAAADVMFQEGQRPAGLQGLQPEVDFAQFHGHGVDVHAVDAPADHVAQGVLDGFGCGFVLAGADGGESLGDAVGGGDEEVAAAAGGVADFDRKQGFLGEQGVRNEGVRAYFSLRCKEPIREIVIRDTSPTSARADSA